MQEKYLDKEEQKIMESYKRGEWEEIDNQEEEINNMVEDAKKYLKKNDRINIRIVRRDLNKLKAKAMHEGLPYQTYIASQLHKLAEGRLKEIDKD